MRRALLLSSLLLLACPDDPTPVLPSPDAGVSGPLHDPLSMPEQPTLDPSSFRSAEACRPCHPTHYEQWRSSSHAYAMVDPVYRALVAIRQEDFFGQHDQFCTQCHSSVGTRGGECVTGFTFDALSPVVLEGVTCEACHKVERVDRLNNSGHVLDPEGPMRGTIQDPMQNGFHGSVYSELHGTAELCAGCHDVIEYDGLQLERPYQELRESPAVGKNCQRCHMASSRGPAAVGGPEREVHDHRFVGVGHPLSEGFLSGAEIETRKERTRALLESAASVAVEASPVEGGQQIDLVVTVENLIDAHNFPTGSTFNRQAWLHVTARDARGDLLYETGFLDDNDDLGDYFSEIAPYGDPDLITFQSGFVDDRGVPTIFSWRASEHFSTTISPLHARTHTLFVPTSTTTVGPVHVEATLKFRIFRPHVLRALQLEALAEGLEIFEVATAATDVEIR